MTEKIFDSVFLRRLALTMKAVEYERLNPADQQSLDTGEEEAIYIAYQERGGDPIAAKEQLAAADERCHQAFGCILQFIADQYGCGPIEQAADAMLKDLTHDGIDAAENWGEYVDRHDGVAPRDTALRSLLNAHRQFEETKHNLHDKLLWPLAKRIWPED